MQKIVRISAVVLFVVVALASATTTPKDVIGLHEGSAPTPYCYPYPACAHSGSLTR